MANESPQTISLVPERAGSGLQRAYLLVLEADGSALFDLPASGQVVIGRGDTADLRLQQQAASRQHARLTIGAGHVVLEDLGSHNGTRVNGEWARGPRQLSTGDVISICDCTLVLHATSRGPGLRPICEPQLFDRRLDEELERATDGGRALSIASISLGETAASRDAIARAASGPLRLIDVLGWGGLGELLVAMPEVGAQTAAAIASLLLEALSALTPQARAGVASLPEDGVTAEALLGAARGAAAKAQTGTVADAAKATTRLQLGDREVLVADPAMARLYELLHRLAQSDLPVLVSGETGSGKENAAFAVHHWSRRSARPFVAINCASIAESLLESELFGHEKGAFTGAVGSKAGLFESAEGGTLFLDEVGELSPAAQAKLLRALETHRIQRVGALRDKEVDVRVVAATHRDLQKEAEGGRFRQDLYFRLGAARVALPPLRDRPRELAVLARAFLEGACGRLGRQPMALSAAAMLALSRHAWPGNVRELKNAMEFVAAAVPDQELQPWHLPGELGAAHEGDGDRAELEGRMTPPQGAGQGQGQAAFRPIAEEVAELERTRMAEALIAAGGNRTRAASLIRMPLRTFVTKLKQHGLGKK